MTDAINTPVRRTRRETSTEEFAIGQHATIDMSGELEHGEILTAVDGALFENYAEALKFDQDPITIQISRSAGKNSALVVDCWVNGKGAEMLINNKWVSTGWMPVNRPITTKRMYAEVLARAKVDTIDTDVGKVGDDDPRNEIVRTTDLKNNFTVLRDANPKGRIWLERLMAEV